MAKYIIEISDEDKKAIATMGLMRTHSEVQERISSAISHGLSLEEGIYITNEQYDNIKQTMDNMQKIFDNSKILNKEKTALDRVLDYCNIITDKDILKALTVSDREKTFGENIAECQFFLTTDKKLQSVNRDLIGTMSIYEKEMEIYNNCGLSKEDVFAFNFSEQVYHMLFQNVKEDKVPKELKTLVNIIHNKADDLRNRFEQAEMNIMNYELENSKNDVEFEERE